MFLWEEIPESFFLSLPTCEDTPRRWLFRIQEEALTGNQIYQYIDLWLLASRTVTEEMSVVWVTYCGIVLWQSEQAKTSSIAVNKSLFLSMIFISLVLTFRYFLHFELMFVCVVRYGSNFIVLHVYIQHHLLKHYSFLIGLLCYSCWKSINWSVRIYLWSLILFHWSISILLPVPYCLDYWVSVL